jgi:hypothetical protein
MRKPIALAVAVGLLWVMMAHAALAVPGETTTCQPGSDEGRSSSWEEIEWAAALAAFIHPDDPTFLSRAEAIVAFNDHNGDGSVCVMTQYLPNANSGSDTWYQIEDNHYDPPQAARG